MKVSYFPGCSLHGTAREYADSIEAVCEALGVQLDELDDWNCCGSSPASATNHALGLALSARNLEIADKAGKTLVIPCAACFQKLKMADKELKAGRPIECATTHYKGSFPIKHIGDFLWEDVGGKTLAKAVKKPLTGLNPVCYYGCLTTRPPLVTDAPNPENPESIDNLMLAVGANVRNWSYKTDCCGGNMTLTRPDIVSKMVQKILDMALESGADCIVTGCPMCFTNLDTNEHRISQETNKAYNLPIFYLSELLGLALANPDAPGWFRRHMVDPRPLLKQKGLL